MTHPLDKGFGAFAADELADSVTYVRSQPS